SRFAAHRIDRRPRQRCRRPAAPDASGSTPDRCNRAQALVEGQCLNRCRATRRDRWLPSREPRVPATVSTRSDRKCDQIPCTVQRRLSTPASLEQEAERPALSASMESVVSPPSVPAKRTTSAEVVRHPLLSAVLRAGSKLAWCALWIRAPGRG